MANIVNRFDAFGSKDIPSLRRATNNAFRDQAQQVNIELNRAPVLTSPNGTQYRLVVADDGSLSTEAV